MTSAPSCGRPHPREGDERCVRAVTVHAPVDAARVVALESALLELGALTVSTTDSPHGARLEAEFAEDIEPEALRDALERLARALSVRELRVEVAEPAPTRIPVLWRRRLAPARVGPLAIVAADEPSAGLEDARVVRIEPGMAFGTVGHPTTTMCLEWLVEHCQPPPRSLLDVGTGTGILALAALALGVARAVVLDVDIESRGVAAENARLNGVEDRLVVAGGELAAIYERFPVVLGNILTEPLVAMAAQLVAVTAEGGSLVLSGVRAREEPELAGAYAAHGFQIAERHERGGWLVVVLRAVIDSKVGAGHTDR